MENTNTKIKQLTEEQRQALMCGTCDAAYLGKILENFDQSSENQHNVDELFKYVGYWNKAVTVSGGSSEAKRSGAVPAYRLFYKGFLEDVAAALAEGHQKYSEGEFDRNYQHGDSKFYRECLDHVLEHLYTYNETGDRYHNGEDHLSHAAAGLMMLMYGEDFGKVGWPRQEAEQFDDPPFDEHQEELEREEIIYAEQAGRVPTITSPTVLADPGSGWFQNLFKTNKKG